MEVFMSIGTMKGNNSSEIPASDLSKSAYPRITNTNHYLVMPPGSSSGLYRTTNEPLKILPAPPKTNSRSILKKPVNSPLLYGSASDLNLSAVFMGQQAKKLIAVPTNNPGIEGKSVKVLGAYIKNNTNTDVIPSTHHMADNSIVLVTTQSVNQSLQQSKFTVTKPQTTDIIITSGCSQPGNIDRSKLRMPMFLQNPANNYIVHDKQYVNTKPDGSNLIFISQPVEKKECPDLTPISKIEESIVFLPSDTPNVLNKIKFKQKLLPLTQGTQGFKGSFYVPVRTKVKEECPTMLEGTDLNKIISKSGNCNAQTFQITNGKIITCESNLIEKKDTDKKDDLLLVKSYVVDKIKSESDVKAEESSTKNNDLCEIKAQVESSTKNNDLCEIKPEEDELSKMFIKGFDPITALEWNDKIGDLPLSELKFKVSEHGLLVLAEDQENYDADAQEIKSSQKSISDKMLCCHTCRTYGLGCEFFNSRFCSKQCYKIHAEEKAEAARKMLERQEKKTKIKEQKLKLLQQRASLEKLGLHEAKGAIDEKIKLLKMEQELLKISSSAGDSDGESGSCSSQNVDYARTPCDRKNFSWTRYLNNLKAKSAPYTLFKDPFPSSKNTFKPGMKLEGIDPVHPSLFCVLTVSGVLGYRIKLHFDGYPDVHDFWVNANSNDIFHAGWCERTNHKLSGPRGYHEKTFNWGNYLRVTKTMAAPKSCFVNNQEKNIVPTGFRVGMKLEAVDKRNSNLVCVASIVDVLDNRILIHFDSWDDIYNYWADATSPYIHPVGWCKENGHQLTPPNEYSSPSQFAWDDYLRETRSLPAPARAFKSRPVPDFRRGMKIECEDKRNPVLIRVATVVDMKQHQIKIKFDGWPDQYGYWVDDDDPAIHPAGWCEKTGHPLEPPPSEDDIKNTSVCPTPGCRGIGHAKRLSDFHNMVIACPYSSTNYLRDDLVPDRFCSRTEYYEVKETSLSKGTKPRPGLRKKTEVETSNDGKADNRGRKRKAPRGIHFHKKKLIKMKKEDVNKQKNADDAGGEDDVDGGDEEEEEEEEDDERENDNKNVLKWSPEQVSQFVESDHDCCEKGKLFLQHKIDGEAFLMLSQNDLVNILGFKLGPAIVLYNRIKTLRTQVVEQSG